MNDLFFPVIEKTNSDHEEYKTLYNEATDRPISIVSQQYELIPNFVARDICLEIAEKNEWNQKIEVIFNDGRSFIWRHISQEKGINLNGEKLKWMLEVRNDYGVKMRKLRICVGLWRQICSNGLGVYLQKLSVAHAHRTEFNNTSEKLKEAATLLVKFVHILYYNKSELFNELKLSYDWLLENSAGKYKDKWKNPNEIRAWDYYNDNIQFMERSKQKNLLELKEKFSNKLMIDVLGLDKTKV